MSLSLILFVIFVVAAVIAALVRPKYGLYAYTLMFYIHPPSRWWGEILPDLRWSLIFAGLTLVSAVIHRQLANKSQVRDKTLRYWFLFVVWVWVTSAWAIDVERQSFIAELFAKYLLLWWLMTRVLTTPEELKEFLMVHVMGCFYLGYIAFTSHSGGRLEGVGGPGIDDANTLGMQCAAALVVAGVLSMTEKGWIRWVSFASIPFILNTVILAGSRGAFVAILACGLYMFWVKPKSLRGPFLAYGMLGIVAFLFLVNEEFLDRIVTLGATVDETQEVDGSSQSRLVVIEAQLEMAKNHALGLGHKGTLALSDEYIPAEYHTKEGAGRASHNTYMSFLVDQGIPGAILFAMILFSAFSVLRRARAAGNPQLRGPILAIAGSLALLLVAGLASNFQKAEVMYWMLALTSVLVRLLQVDPVATPDPSYSKGLARATRRHRGAHVGRSRPRELGETH